MKPTRYSQVIEICKYLVNASPTERSTENISFGTQISYQMVRRYIREYYPHVFKYVEGVGWFLTGLSPVPEIPIDFDSFKKREVNSVASPRMVDSSKFVREVEPPVKSASGWVYNQSALRFLDTLFPGKTFAEVLHAADQKDGGLKELEVIGKTLAKAAQDFAKNGKVPF